MTACRSGMFSRLLAATLLTAFPSAWAQGPGLPVLGAIEDVRIEPEAIALRARVDTGADNSSLGVERLRRFRREGKPWVAFEILGPGGSRSRLERQILRTATIRGLAGRRERRPTVLITLCIADTSAETEVNLADRTEMNYPMLIGRSSIAGRFLIDPGRELLTHPSCRPRGGR